jgi:hypothetical protein
MIKRLMRRSNHLGNMANVVTSRTTTSTLILRATLSFQKFPVFLPSTLVIRPMSILVAAQCRRELTKLKIKISSVKLAGLLPRMYRARKKVPMTTSPFNKRLASEGQ